MMHKGVGFEGLDRTLDLRNMKSLNDGVTVLLAVDFRNCFLSYSHRWGKSMDQIVAFMASNEEIIIS